MEKVNHSQRLKDQMNALLQPIADAVAEGSDINAGDFVLPFQGCMGRPHNPATGHAATGTNALIAMMMGCNFYSTYDGWQRLGYFVNTKADFYLMRPMTKKVGEQIDTLTGESKAQFATTGFVSYGVWSFESVKENVRVEVRKRDKHPIPAQPWQPPALKKQDDTQIIEAVDSFVANTGAVIRHTNDGKACYTPSLDTITMPNRSLFSATKTSTATECYYSTELHELGHWTGHKSRLDRLGKASRFGDTAYAREELVAELGAAFQCAMLGVSITPREDHAKYLNNWISVLKNDSRAILTAAAAAEKAVQFIEELQGQSQEEAA